MKLLRYILVLFLVAVFLNGVPAVVFGDIPPEIELTAVFNYNDQPIDGYQTVTVRLFYSDQLDSPPFYKQVVKDVLFNKGVGKIVIGGDGSDLINSYFDVPNIVVSISVMQAQIIFPINSVPYTIRAKESNKARRVDNESIIKFLEQEQRVGVHNVEPEVTFDVNGVVVLHNIRDSDEKLDGVLYWDGSQNEFFVYRNGRPVSMSWVPRDEIQSKWDWDIPSNLIWSLKPVGIGAVPNDDIGLRVNGDSYLSESVYFGSDLNVFSYAKLNDGQGFDEDGNLSVHSIDEQFDGINQWNVNGNGDLKFSGRLVGQAGPGLTGLHQFKLNVFLNNHFDSGSIVTNNIIDNTISKLILSDEIITTTHVKKNQVLMAHIDDYSIAAKHIIDGEIQTHHMKKNQVSSEDIKLNTFGKAKFVNDVIHPHHIVDGEINGDKIKVGHIINAHFDLSVPFVSTDKIKNGELNGDHVPKQSISMTDLSDFFPVAQGGTGKDHFETSGVLYSNSDAEYMTSPTTISIENGRMGIGRSPEPGILMTVYDESNAKVAIVSNGFSDDQAATSVLTLQNQSVSWNLRVDESGHLSMLFGDDPLMSFVRTGVVGSLEGMGIGVGTENPTEALSLTGPVVLGPSSCTTDCISGSIRYQDGQFSAFIDSSWHPITSSGLSYRYFDHDDRRFLAGSSVVFSEESAIVGDHLMVRSSSFSEIAGQLLDVGNVDSSIVFGGLAKGRMIESSLVSLDHSDASGLVSSTVNARMSFLSHVHESDVVLDSSNAEAVFRSTLHSNWSEGSFLSDAESDLNHSRASFLNNSNVDANQSRLSFLDQSVLTLNHAQAGFLNDVQGSLFQSSALHLSRSDVNVAQSQLIQVSDSSIHGAHHLIVGGDGHLIKSDHALTLSGRRHLISGDRAIAIGDDIHARHDDVVMINASSRPLESDRSGQLKIQADGGIDIKFSDDMGISMSESASGWSVISDASLKTSKLLVDPMHILSKVRQLPIQYWQYKSQDNINHVGPTAQDFYGLFNYGNSDKVIHSIDSDGVLLASVKGLFLTLDELKQLLVNDQRLFDVQSKEVERIIQDVDQLKSRLDKMDQSYQLYFRTLDQFDSDFKNQQTMIAYVHDHVHRFLWMNRLSSFKGVGWLILFGVGAIFGMVLAMIFRRVGS